MPSHVTLQFTVRISIPTKQQQLNCHKKPKHSKAQSTMPTSPWHPRQAVTSPLAQIPLRRLPRNFLFTGSRHSGLDFTVFWLFTAVNNYKHMHSQAKDLQYLLPGTEDGRSGKNSGIKELMYGEYWVWNKMRLFSLLQNFPQIPRCTNSHSTMNRVLTNLEKWNSPSFPDPPNRHFQTIMKRKPDVVN